MFRTRNRVAELAGIVRDRAARATEAVLEVSPWGSPRGRWRTWRRSCRWNCGEHWRTASLAAVARPYGCRSRRSARGRPVRALASRGSVQHTKTVFAVLREAVGDKEFSDTVAQLPGEYRELLRRD
jgi:hypothetical protein